LDEPRGVLHAQGVGAERTQPHGAELRITDDDWIRRPPFVIRELLGVHEQNFGLERTVEAVFPAADRGEQRQVGRRERMTPRTEDVGDVALINEQRQLARPYDQLRAVLDLVLGSREAIEHRVAGFVQPIDDVDQFTSDEFAYRHRALQKELKTSERQPVWAASGQQLLQHIAQQLRAPLVLVDVSRTVHGE